MVTARSSARASAISPARRRIASRSYAGMRRWFSAPRTAPAMARSTSPASATGTVSITSSLYGERSSSCRPPVVHSPAMIILIGRWTFPANLAHRANREDVSAEPPLIGEALLVRCALGRDRGLARHLRRGHVPPDSGRREEGVGLCRHHDHHRSGRVTGGDEGVTDLARCARARGLGPEGGGQRSQVEFDVVALERTFADRPYSVTQLVAEVVAGDVHL